MNFFVCKMRLKKPLSDGASSAASDSASVGSAAAAFFFSKAARALRKSSSAFARTAVSSLPHFSAPPLSRICRVALHSAIRASAAAFASATVFACSVASTVSESDSSSDACSTSSFMYALLACMTALLACSMFTDFLTDFLRASAFIVACCLVRNTCPKEPFKMSDGVPLPVPCTGEGKVSTLAFIAYTDGLKTAGVSGGSSILEALEGSGVLPPSHGGS
mmetsp:Transcript_38384/g.67737  ORF Transcript_38384/g.67737 Transcript_38384/m.67737 type:complete len:220 (-) Transcript_38384:187-846(-)